MPTEKQLACGGSDINLLRHFLLEFFDYPTLKKIGFFGKNIKKKDYYAQAERICEFFGLQNIYEYGTMEVTAHLSYAEGATDTPKEFLTEIKNIYT
jgi:hypothetical protein